ncbi:MAG: hypothetical protein SGILL_003167, partial [Bacillariaceae sp.]
LDSHSSVAKELRVYTVQGAVLSVITVAAILYLVSTEITYNFQTMQTERVHVNSTSPRGLEVEFDISLPQVPCSLLKIDANDQSQQTISLHLDRSHHIWKHRIKVTEDGTTNYIGDKHKLEQGSTLLLEEHLEQHLASIAKDMEEAHDEEEEEEDEEDECGSCFGAGEEGECCDTCDDVKRAYQRKGWHLENIDSIKQCKAQKGVVEDEGEGCNVHGLIALDSGGGSFHLAPGRSDDTGARGEAASIFEMLFRTFEQFNVTHTVHKIRFGDDYPLAINQLDGETRVIADGYGMYQYYFKIVPTCYQFQNGTTIHTNQYSVTEHLRHVNPGGGRGLPGVFFYYEISPLHVEVVEGYRKGYIAFFTSVCAIVGGVVTSLGLLDQLLYSRNRSPTGEGLVL